VTGARLRGGLLALLVLCAASLAGAEAAEKPTVIIGVRVDTPPFAWQDDETGAFRGYLTDLCVEAVTRAGFHFEQVAVTAAARVGVLDGVPEVRTDETPPRDVTLDLLCDPTTISLSRLQKLLQAPARPNPQAPLDGAPQGADPERLAFSPIVFVANGSYATEKKFVPTLERAVGNGADDAAFLAESGASLVSCRCIVSNDQEGCPEQNGFLRAAYVVGTTSQHNIDLAIERDRLGVAGAKICRVEMPSHEAMVEALCAEKVQYSFGDIDIAVYFGSQMPNCQIEPADDPLSYEPYALLVSNQTEGFRPRFMAALYEMFSDGTVAGRFGTYFPGLAKSSALTMLFRINSIPGMRDLPAVRASAQCDDQGGGGSQGSECHDGQTEPGEQQERSDGIAALGRGDHGAGAEDQGGNVEGQHQ
jgi:ABC-type amino acid transport substrate-binding protein